MTARVTGVVCVFAGAVLGALAGAVIVHRSPTSYRAIAVLLGEHDAAPTAPVAYAAGVLAGQQDPMRHIVVEVRRDPTRLVVAGSQLVDASSVIATNAVAEAYAWRSAAARWQQTGMLAVADFEVNIRQWGSAPPLFVVPPAHVRRDPHGAGGSKGSLAFTCDATRCGTWTRMFLPFRHGGSYVISADLRGPTGRARLIVGLGADRTSSSSVLSGQGWTRVSVRWRPREDEPSAEIAVSAPAGGTYSVDRVRVTDRSVSRHGFARLPAVRLASDGTPVYTSRAVGLEIGALSGVLIAAAGYLCALLALRARNRDAEPEQQPHP